MINDTSDARQAILGRLRSAKQNSRKTSTENESAQQAPTKTTSNTAPLAPRQNRSKLIEMLKENRIEVLDCEHSQWTEALVQLCLDNHWQQILLGSEHQLASAAEEAFKQIKTINVTHFDRRYECIKTELYEQIEVSITPAQAAIADTGSLVLIPDTAHPRTMSLIPPVHIVVLDDSKIIDTMQDYLDTQQFKAEQIPSNILFISSPSKTADIQQTLAYGAHGPKRLIVLLRTSAEVDTRKKNNGK